MAAFTHLDELSNNGSPQGRSQICASVIIPALNEEKVIGRCLDALCAMEFPREHFEVLIVDNGSSDRTLEVALPYADSLNLKIFQKPGVHIAALRNLGASQACGEILAFLDADCLVPRAWLRNAVRYLSESDHEIVGAHYGLPPDSTWVGRIWHEDREAGKVGDVNYLPSGDLIVRRETFSEINGFDESIQTNEDFEFCQRALAKGMKIWSFSELRVAHLGTPQTIKQFFKKNRWHGKHVLRVFLQNLPKLHNVVPLLFALYVLVWLLGILGGCLTAFLTGSFLWLALPLLAPAVPLILVSLRRSWTRGKPQEAAPLTALYILYGVARAFSIFDLPQSAPGVNSNRTLGVEGDSSMHRVGDLAK